MSIDSETLDRIDVRYAVEARFEIYQQDSEPAVATAGLSITCGIYSGIPTREIMANLVNDRCIYADDLTVESGPYSAKMFAQIVNNRGVRADEIRKMILSEVTVDDETVAESLSIDEEAEQDALDSQIARTRLAEIETGNGSLVTGAELEAWIDSPGDD